ncbi:MAG: hypothetical protein NUV81_01355 [bacterium]|nr:hypothetical protein [bacterium]
MGEDKVQQPDATRSNGRGSCEGQHKTLRSISGFIRADMGWDVLDAIASGMEMLEDAVYHPMGALRYGDDFRTMKIEAERQRIRATIRRLERNKIIQKRMESDNRAYQLTTLGTQLRLFRHPPSVLRPGEATIVSFDIPEKYRKERNIFRQFLKSLQYRKIHRSVWASDRDWASLVHLELKRLDIGDWVVVIKGKIL